MTEWICGSTRAMRSSAECTFVSALGAATATVAKKVSGETMINPCIPLLPLSARREQPIQCSLAAARLHQPRIAQAAVPIELHCAVNFAVVDQEFGR